MRSNHARATRLVGLTVGLLALPLTAAAADLPTVGATAALQFGTYPGNGLNLPTDVAVGADGRVYVVDSGRHRVTYYDATANPLGHFGEEGKGDGEMNGPVGIAVGPDGTVYVADRGNQRLQAFRADGKFDRSIALKEEAGAVVPVDVAVSANGKTLYVTANNSHRVVAFDRKGKATGGWGGDGKKAGEFKYPGTIALDASGNVVVADIMNARVQVFDPAGAPTAEIGGLGANPGNFLRPKGVAVAPDGRIFVSDSYFGLVQVFGADGAFAGVLAVGGEPVKFEAPTGLAFAGSRLFVTDMLAGKVLAFDVEGGQ